MHGLFCTLILALCLSAACGNYYPPETIVKEELIRSPVIEIKPPQPQYPHQEQQIVRSEEAMIAPPTQFKTLCGENQSGKSMFYVAHPDNHKWFLQCDENGKVFLKFCPEDTVFTENLVCEVQVGKEKKPIPEQETTVAFKPIVIDITPMMPLSSYPNVAPSSPLSSSSSFSSSSSLSREAPEFRAQCESQRSFSKVAFYLPHPTDRTLFIQCDEFGNAFLQSCQPGLIFTASFTCRREGEDAESTIEVRPPQPPMSMSGPSLSTYQSGSISNRVLLATDLTIDVTTSQEAPEFAEACRSKIQLGVLVFYMKHPSDESKYIQCDEFGKAFLKQCPSGLVFSEKLGCVRREQLEHAETSHELKTLSFDTDVSRVGNADLGLSESLEFKHLCVSKPISDGGSGIFFLPHPSDKMLYIQCDEFGRAFVRQCQFGTVFVSENRACEKEGEQQPLMSFVPLQPVREAIVNLDAYPSATTRLPEPQPIVVEQYPTMPPVTTPVIMFEEPKTTQAYPAMPPVTTPVIVFEEPKTTQAYPAMPLETTPVIVFEEPKTTQAYPAMPPQTQPPPIIVLEEPKTTQPSYPAESKIVLEEIKVTTQVPILMTTTAHIRGRPVLKHNGY